METAIPAHVGAHKGKATTALNRSCEGCRARKIRCQPAESSEAGKCARCEKMKLSCIYLAPQQKRRRKRTDVRVAELEKEIRSLRHRFEGHTEPNSQRASPNAKGDTQTSAVSDRYHPERKKASSPQTSSTREHEDDDADEIEVDDATANLLFRKFKSDLTPHFPFLLLEDELSASDLRETRPILFNAIIAASAASVHAPLGEALFHKAERLYAQNVFIDGNKSLELVQSMILTALWYPPADHYANLKFTTFSHAAGNMALDIRRGREAATSRRHARHESIDTYDDVEGQRALLSCYVVCSIMGLSLRRQQMFTFSSLVARCLTAIESSKVPSDYQIAAWVRLQHIAEEATTGLGYDDLEAATLKETRTQKMLKSYDKQLDLWKNEVWDKINLSVQNHYFYVRCTLHELALYPEYSPRDFQRQYDRNIDKRAGADKIAPYMMQPQPLDTEEHIELDPMYVASVMTCVDSAKSMLDIFISLDTIAVRSIHVLFLTRVFYALVLLTKIMLCTRVESSGIGKIVEPSDINLTAYMQKIINLLHTATGKEEIQKPATFMTAVTKLAIWYHRHMSYSGKSKVDDLLEPLKDLKTSTPDASNGDTSRGLSDVTSDHSEQPPSQVSSSLPMHSEFGPSDPSAAQHGFPTDSTTALAIDPGFATSNTENWATAPWLNNGNINFDAMTGNGGFMMNLTDFDQLWNAGFMDDSPMLMFADGASHT